jgi:hypothetical protein
MRNFKKNIVLFIILIVVTGKVMAQQPHFIYLQTENRQPFYIKIDKKIYSSSAAGYLIIPKLLDGAYTLVLGFPKNEWQEQSINCIVNQKDLGFVLKNFGEKGWGLFNWQTFDIVMSDNGKPAQLEQIVAAPAQVNSNTAVVVPVQLDTTTLPANNEVVNSESKVLKDKKSEEAKLPIDDTLIADAQTKVDKSIALSIVKKLLVLNDSSGTQLVYVDKGNNNQDTITVFIPIEKEMPQSLSKARAEEVQPKIVEAQVDKTNNKKEEVLMVVASKDSAVEKVATTENAVPPIGLNKKIAIPNSDCKSTADENDFLKLRKKMAAENNDDDMVATAKKYFKTTCFTTLQIKNLSLLFLSDSGKYKFFDTAYPFVTDSGEFVTLQNQLTDSYYINRFKAMLRL